MDRLRGGNTIRSLNTVHSVHSMFLLLLYRISGQDAQQGHLLARGLPSTSRLTRHAEPERRLLGGQLLAYTWYADGHRHMSKNVILTLDGLWRPHDSHGR